MATPADCPHDNPAITGDGPYYRQVHPNNFQNGRNLSAAVLQVSRQELIDTGASLIVDSPDGITFAHVDALYEKPMSNRLRSNAGKALLTAANRRGPAYVPHR